MTPETPVAARADPPSLVAEETRLPALFFRDDAVDFVASTARGAKSRNPVYSSTEDPARDI